MISTRHFDVSLTYADFHLLDQSASDGVLAPTAAADVGIFAATTLGHGLLTGKDPRQIAEEYPGIHSADRVQHARKLWEFAQEKGVNLLALNLHFCLRDSRRSAILMGSANPAQIAADVRALKSTIPDHVWDELSQWSGIVIGN